MKNLSLLFVAFLSFTFSNAQNKNGGDFGIKGGLNFATLYSDPTASSKVGVNIGIFLDIKSSEKFHFQPEIIYSMQGTSITSEGQAAQINLNYINLPLMAKYFVNKDFNIQFGPQFGTLVSSTVSVGTVSVDASSVFKNIDYGVNFGLGYTIKPKVMIEARYNIGLSGLAKDLPLGGTDLYNRVFSISIGFKI